MFRIILKDQSHVSLYLINFWNRSSFCLWIHQSKEDKLLELSELYFMDIELI